MKWKVGDKIKFKAEKQRYTIMACDNRFAIGVKPMNALKTYLYTIVDLKRKVRGPHNIVFGIYTYNTREGAEKNLKLLQAGESEVSYRRELKLDIERIDACILD